MTFNGERTDLHPQVNFAIQLIQLIFKFHDVCIVKFNTMYCICILVKSN